MKLLFCTRNDYIKNMAGDSVQLLTMANYLRSKGIAVDINDGTITDFKKYDIVHLFNLTRISETYNYFKMAQAQEKSIVITPIYWNLNKYYKFTESEYHIKLWDMYYIFRNEILNGCKMIYPSSILEENLIKSEYGESLPCQVIYNCIEEQNIAEEKDKCSYILCAARICPRKNQLELAKVCNNLGEKLLLAGSANFNNYLDECLFFDNVTYLGNLQGNELTKIYKGAKLHALCSFVETPSLSSLEAASCGCNILLTSEGSTKEYFGNMATYCNPYDENDLYKSVKEALVFNSQPELKQHINCNFTTDICLQKLIESYYEIYNL